MVSFCPLYIGFVGPLPKWLGFSWLINRGDPNYLLNGMILQGSATLKTTPTRNNGFIAGLTKGNQCVKNNFNEQLLLVGGSSFDWGSLGESSTNFFWGGWVGTSDAEFQHLDPSEFP